MLRDRPSNDEFAPYARRRPRESPIHVAQFVYTGLRVFYVSCFM